jgi:hypothetical protein
VTDARLHERFLTDRRVRRLSDAEFRLYVTALVWSVANRTDGVIIDDDLPLIPDVDAALAPALVKAELWHRQRGRWRMDRFAAEQTSRHELEVLENVRRRDREKKARQRARDAAVPGDVPGDMSRGTAQEGKEGKDRRLEEATTAELLDQLGAASTPDHQRELIAAELDHRGIE